MYTKITLTILFGLSFLNSWAQDTVGVYKEIGSYFLVCEERYERENSNFYEIRFNDNALFNCNRFLKVADFRDAQFASETNFRYTQFHSLADFRDAKFNFLANFRDTQFDSETNFRYTQFASEGYFSNAQFASETNFSNAQFASEGYFNEARFGSRAEFVLARFGSYASFYNAQFDSLADFNVTQFDSLVRFGLVKFTSESYFIDAQFHSRVSFYNARFGSRSSFYNARFDSRADFRDTQFDSLAEFSSAQFDSRADFNHTQFDSRADFRDTQFDSRADFSHASFNGITDFSSTTLPDTLYFNKVKNIAKEIDFTFSIIDSTKRVCKIDLVDTEISKIKLRYNRFQLIFPDTTYNYEQKSNVYEQLLKVQEKHGFRSSLEKLDKEYKEFQYLENPKNEDWVTLKLNQIANFIQKNWWDYGYDKARVIWWTIGLLLFFFILNSVIFDYLLNEVYTIDQIKEVNRKQKFILFRLYSVQYKFDYHYTRFWLPFYYTCLIFFGLRMSVEKFKFSKNLGVAYLFIQYVMGLVCLAYIANFIILSK